MEEPMKNEAMQFASQLSKSSASQDDLRESTIGLFTYLRELAKLRGTVNRVVENYESILWFFDIPKERECYTPAWGDIREGYEDIWLEIKKPRFSSPPAVPVDVKPWIDENQLDNLTSKPEIKERILISDSLSLQGDKIEKSTIEFEAGQEYIELYDNMSILELWEKYLTEKWKPWVDEQLRLKKVRDVYAKLYEMYQYQKIGEETYELVLGLGLLTWNTPSGQFVKRPLIVAQATIELDTQKGTLSVKQGAEGAKPILEDEMLALEERCSPELRKRIEEELINIGDEIWRDGNIESLLKEWVNSVSADGVYNKELAPPNKLSSAPCVTYAPVLILRKRDIRGWVTSFNTVIQEVEKGAMIPFAVQRVIKILDDYTDDMDADNRTPKTCDSAEILFLKPTNAEQEKIIEYLAKKKGIVVQGPPGTGKSHTIANLISHLLAAGERVLVTSETPRALNILRKMIPNDIAALCVCLLGQDRDSLESLERSVKGISEHKMKWENDPNEDYDINGLSKELEQAHREKAELTRKLREARERETYKHRICEGEYVGTAQEIASRVASESKQHNWLDVSIPADILPVLTNEEALELLDLNRSLNIMDELQDMGKLALLPSPQDFLAAINQERMVQEKCKPFDDIKREGLYKNFRALSAEALLDLRMALLKSLRKRQALSLRSEKWVSGAMQDILSGNDRRWRYLYNFSKKTLSEIEKIVTKIDQREIQSPEESQRSVPMADDEQLLKHLDEGDKIDFLDFYPKPVRKDKYLITKMYGRLSKIPETLKIFLESLRLDLKLKTLWREWSVHASRTEGSRTAQFHYLSSLSKLLEEVINLSQLITRAMKLCERIPGMPQSAWHISRDLELYIRVIDAIKADEVLRRASSLFEKTIQVLEPIRATKNVPPSINDLHLSVIDRNENAYSQAYEKLKSLVKLGTERKSFLTKKLAKLAYPVVERLSSDLDNSEWDERCSHFVKSWHWAQAKTWLNEYVGNPRERELNIKLERIETRIGSITARLAAAKAWHHCMNRMNQKEEQHLKAWANAMRKVGKDRGRHAEHYRREAHSHIEECRSAIPAWIMPLYRVVETVKPGVDLFDVVIIDEASQSSSEALLLFFLAKKIIIMGDHEQISPQSIGVDRNQVANLRDQYIRNIPHKDAVNPDTSFFALCNILFSGKIVLREHFRCMPEIIGFSNQLCYTSTPLQPLRQYSRNRLEPIKTVHVSNGYRAGTQTMASNPPEAEAVVAKIKECCKDSSYDGKSMGVISLLGDSQARIIQRKLLDEIGAQEMEKRKLMCGDAYAFQGDERDVMFLSMVVAPGETEMRAITADIYKQRFNVATSRARDQVWLFHTPTLNDFRNQECLRYQLLKYYLEHEDKAIITEDLNLAQLRRQANQERGKDVKSLYKDKFDSWFKVDVFLKIVDKGYRVIPQFKFAGYSIYLVVEGMERRLAVECYGDHWHSDLHKQEEDMRRQRILERCGWTFWIVWGSEFYLNQENAMESLWEKLNFLGIAPGGKDIDFNTSVVTPGAFSVINS